jgi:hypothetical protein
LLLRPTGHALETVSALCAKVALTKAPWFWDLSQTPLHRCLFIRQPNSVAFATRRPVGTGSAQIRWSIDPNSCRVRWLSANSSQ